MLTSKSTRGCRLSANAPTIIRSVNSGGGLTSGAIDPSFALGRSKPVKRVVKSNRRGQARTKLHKALRDN